MSSKPSGFEYWPFYARRRVLDSAQIESKDTAVRIERLVKYNQTEAMEASRLAQRSHAEIARANRDLIERSLQQRHELGENLICELRDIASSLNSLETSLTAKLDDLNRTASAIDCGLQIIVEMIFHHITGRDYEATLRRRAAEAEEVRRLQTIVADYNEALAILKVAATEKNSSKCRLQMDQAELCLRRALSVSAIEAQAAMDLGTLLFMCDENLAEAAVCYERSIRGFTRWSSQWVYASRLLANVESRSGSPQKAYERMEEILNYRTSLGRFGDEVRGINRDDDHYARVKRIDALISKIHALGGASVEGVESIKAELASGKKATATDAFEKAEAQLLKMFTQARPDPEVFYDAARFATDCGKHAEAAQHLKTRSTLYGNDLLARRAFLLQIQATPEFA